MPESLRSTSPVVTPRSDLAVRMGLSFYDALREVAKGKKVSRYDWADHKTYVYLAPDETVGSRIVALKKADDPQVHGFIVTEADMEPTDWMVLD